jgi:hypothetical protein
MTIYMVINKETGISHCGFYNQQEAEQKAKEMTEYHNKQYIVKELETERLFK